MAGAAKHGGNTEMFYFDPLYLVFALPALLLTFYAQWKVKSAYSKYSKVPNRRGQSGLDFARQILGPLGLSYIGIEGVPGELTDHYDPRDKVLRLSQGVAYGRTIAALAIVAHETGHALQDAKNYAPLRMRGAIVPAVTVSAWVGPILFMLGWFIGMSGVAWLGVAVFGMSLVFALVTLPVELDASRRGLKILESFNALDRDELKGARAVLTAAALTYVAALAQTLSTMLYYVFLLSSSRRQD